MARSAAAKNRPVLLAALVAQADFLLTGDVTHFCECLDRSISGVTPLSRSAS